MRLENNYSAIDKVNSISFVKLILGIDVFILLCTLIRYNNLYSLDNVILKWIIPKFDLAVENTFAVWWSGILLFLIGFLAYQHYLLEKGDTKKAWLGISIIFMGLSIDEIASLHERIGGLGVWYAYFPLALACFIVLSYSLQKLFFKNESRFTAILLSLAVVLFAFSAFQEYLEWTVNLPSWAFGPRLVFEEGTELVGSLVGLIGVVSYPNRKHMRQLKNLLPKASTIKRYKNLLFTLLVIHFFLSMTTFSWSYLKILGHPIVWYPMIVYFILFLYSLQKFLKESTNNFYLSLMLSAGFLFCSALIPYVFTSSFNWSLSSEKWIFDASFLISFYNLFHALQLFMCLCLFFSHLNSSILGRILVILVFINILIGLFFFHNLVLVFIIIGFNSYIYYYLIVRINFSIQRKVGGFRFIV